MKAQLTVTASQLEDWVNDVKDWADGKEMITCNTVHLVTNNCNCYWYCKVQTTPISSQQQQQQQQLRMMLMPWPAELRCW